MIYSAKTMTMRLHSKYFACSIKTSRIEIDTSLSMKGLKRRCKVLGRRRRPNDARVCSRQMIITRRPFTKTSTVASGRRDKTRRQHSHPQEKKMARCQLPSLPARLPKVNSILTDATVRTPNNRRLGTLYGKLARLFTLTLRKLPLTPSRLQVCASI